jgi:hypothetical protein
MLSWFGMTLLIIEKLSHGRSDGVARVALIAWLHLGEYTSIPL